MRAIPVWYRRGFAGDALVDDDVFDEMARYSWHRSGNHVVRGLRRGEAHLSVSMHRQILGLLSGDPRAVHHINENGFDNRRENLMVCANKSEANRQPHPKAAAAGVEGWRRYCERVAARAA